MKGTFGGAPGDRPTVDKKCSHCGLKNHTAETCFKLHAPQTFEHDEGYLYVDTLETKISEKWTVSMDSMKYDAFFDFSIAFWVKSLDKYIIHWDSNENLRFEYIGIEWTLPSDLEVDIDDRYYKDDRFYSILIHLPDSQQQFEFMSFIRPHHILYAKLHWIHQDVPRATFQLNQPWNRSDEATIVPVRISRATTNANKLYNFYTNLLEANLLYHAHDTDLDGDDVRTIFMALPGTHIEIQFVQRPLDSTFGDFKLDQYEQLLMDTHDAIITSPYCGQVLLSLTLDFGE